MIASHASSNGIPAELVHRVIVRESRYRASAMGRGGASGLMQIKLATARSMGYSGSAAGLLDPDTNLTYGVRYLAGAYRAASGHHGRAVGYYASGYRGAARPASAYAKMRPEPAVFTTAASGEPMVVRAQGAAEEAVRLTVVAHQPSGESNGVASLALANARPGARRASESPTASAARVSGIAASSAGMTTLRCMHGNRFSR